MAYEKELEAVEKAATTAVDLVTKFADQDPSDPTSCWQNPTRMYEQLDQARDRALEAWKILEQAKKTASATEVMEQQQPQTQADNTAVHTKEQDLRALFMDMVTDAFADVLAEMKDGEEDIDLDVLVDCLQSGMEILSQEDREFLTTDENFGAEEEDVMVIPSPHEERRQELGFQRVETTA